MKVSMPLSYAGGFKESAAQAVALEKAGLDTVWVAEAYGFDGVSLMGYLSAVTETVEIGAAILPIYTRTPTLLGMTAAGVDALSDGRCILGIGASGPQVIEGFHGVPYTQPLTRTREIIDICRQVWARERVAYDGKAYTLPLPPDQGTGLGKSLKLITKPVRDRIPVYVAALGPKNVRMTAEVADGWLPLFYLPDKVDDVWGDELRAGAAARADDLDPLQIVAGGLLAVGDDAGSMRDLARPMLALYVGGMGAKGRNFYNDLACRYGFEDAAKQIQDLYLEGNKREAVAAVPDELVDEISLIGPKERIADRLEAWKESGITTMIVGAQQPEALQLMAELTL
jgi:F420-dependent oxidoreductase-like protein